MVLVITLYVVHFKSYIYTTPLLKNILLIVKHYYSITLSLQASDFVHLTNVLLQLVYIPPPE